MKNLFSLINPFSLIMSQLSIKRSAFTISYAAMIGLMMLSASAVPARTPDDVVVMGMSIDDIVSLDPAETFEFTGAEITGNLYERLVTIDLENPTRVIGGAARSWSHSADGLVTRFQMRPDALFASGRRVSAKDAAWSLQRVIRLNKSPAFILAQFGLTPDNVEKLIYAENDDILVIRTQTAFSPTFLLSCLTSGIGSILDRETVLAHETDGDLGHAWLKKHSAGSGPFVLAAWRPKEYVILEANQLYRQGKPDIQRLIIQHIGETATQRLMLEKGDIDIARGLTPDQVAGIKDNPMIQVTISPKSKLYYIALNQTHHALANPKVRRALRYLIDDQELARTVIRERGHAHQTIVPEGIFSSLDAHPYRFDLARAKALLAEAGYDQGFDVEMDAYGAIAEDLAQAVQASFAKANIRVEIIPGDRKQILTKYRARNHQIFIGEWGSDYLDPHSNIDAFAANRDNGHDAVFRTLAWRNHWRDPELTSLALAGIHVTEPEKRAEIYQMIQKRVLIDSPFIILFQGTDVIVSHRRVSGFRWGPSFDTNFYHHARKTGQNPQSKAAQQ